MVYNRYVGNTGRFIRVDDEPVIVERAEVIEPFVNAPVQEKERPPAPRGGGGLSALLGGGSGLFGGKGLLGGKGLFGGKSLGFLDKLLPFGMDTGDLALIVLFFFLYIESGDDEFLIIMAFLAYSIFKDRPK